MPSVTNQRSPVRFIWRLNDTLLPPNLYSRGQLLNIQLPSATSSSIAKNSLTNSLTTNSIASDSFSSSSNLNHRINDASSSTSALRESIDDHQASINKYNHNQFLVNNKQPEEDEWLTTKQKSNDFLDSNLGNSISNVQSINNQMVLSHRLNKRTSVHSSNLNRINLTSDVNNLNDLNDDAFYNLKQQKIKSSSSFISQQMNDRNLNLKNLKNQSTFFNDQFSMNNNDKNEQLNRSFNDDSDGDQFHRSNSRSKKNKKISNHFLESNQHHLDSNSNNLNSISNNHYLDNSASFSSNQFLNYNNASELYISKLNLDTRLYSFGMIQCYAENEIGIGIDEPCIYQIIPAGKFISFF